jgi:hypothetical protein
MIRLLNKKFKRGASLIEYIAFFLIIIGGLYVMKGPISRGLFSKYKASAEAFGFGRQYSSQSTTICKTDILEFDTAGNPVKTITYDEDCFQSRVARTAAQGGCYQCHPDASECFACEDRIKQGCQKAYCNQ